MTDLARHAWYCYKGDDGTYSIKDRCVCGAEEWNRWRTRAEDAEGNNAEWIAVAKGLEARLATMEAERDRLAAEVATLRETPCERVIARPAPVAAAVD